MRDYGLQKRPRETSSVQEVASSRSTGDIADAVREWNTKPPIEYIRNIMSLVDALRNKAEKDEVLQVEIPLYDTTCTLAQLLELPPDACTIDESVYKFGLEIEGCFCNDEYDGGTLPSFDLDDKHFETFKVDVDSTIECGATKCEDGELRFEMELITDGTFQITDLDTDPYKKDMKEVRRLFKMSCSKDSCGTHVHMSRKTDDVRGMAAALQRVWLVHQTDMVRRYYGPVRAASMYCNENKCVLQPCSYEKYMMLNMCPCVEWSTKEFHDGELHVEFRGLGERLEWWGEEDLGSLKTYLRDLMTIWSHAHLLHNLLHHLPK